MKNEKMRKIICTLLSLTVLIASGLCFSQRSVYATSPGATDTPDTPETVVQAQTAELTLSCDNMPEDVKPADYFKHMTDSDQYTYCLFEEDVRIRVSASVPVSSLYIMFEQPTLWTLTLPDGKNISCGENDFLHEFISLQKKVSGFDLNIPAGSMITDLYAFTDGSLPEWVQIWEPPCERADLMVMPTHADDEHLWFGGALPYYAGELGYNVQVVYLTNHKNQSYRGHELLNGLWTVGVRNYPVITDKFVDDKITKESIDAAAAYFGRDNVTEFQVEMLRRFAPRVVIAHDIEGEYGHGAHKLNASTLLEALKIYDDPTVYPESAEKYGVNKVQKVYLHKWHENRITVTWSEKKLERFGGRDALYMAIQGYLCHKSQLEYNFWVTETDIHSCRKFGLAYTTVGYDTPDLNDMFENVDWSDVTRPGQEKQEEDMTASSVSDSDSRSAKPAGFLTSTFFGRNFTVNDIVFGATVIIMSLTAVIILICLVRRE